MHNIDRNQLEIGWENGNYEYDTEGEVSDEEIYDELYGETYDEADEASVDEASVDEAEGYYGEAEGPFSEAEEMELAAELLSVSNEEELDQFLGKLIKKASRFMKSPLGRQLGGALKGLAKNLIPGASTALNSVVPGLGTALGGVANSYMEEVASGVFGMELEGLSAEDQEYEIARRFVRLAGDAAQEAASIPPVVPPQQAAQAALNTAAQKHAPGLVSGSTATQQPRPRRRSGRWVRRGKTIILYGI